MSVKMSTNNKFHIFKQESRVHFANVCCDEMIFQRKQQLQHKHTISADTLLSLLTHYSLC